MVGTHMNLHTAHMHIYAQMLIDDMYTCISHSQFSIYVWKNLGKYHFVSA